MSLGDFSKAVFLSYVECVKLESESHTKNLRAATEKALWPQDIVNSLHVDVIDGKYVATTYKKQQVEDIAFGNAVSGNQPSPVILNFMNTLGVKS